MKKALEFIIDEFFYKIDSTFKDLVCTTVLFVGVLGTLCHFMYW